MKTAYRIYDAPEGSDLSFCGERDTLEEAQQFAETGPVGLERSLWDTVRVAGHFAGMTAPDGGDEDEEPISWHGASGWHCVVRVLYAD